MENKYIIVARSSLNPRNLAEINDQHVEIYGFSGSCSLAELTTRFPQARQFMVLFTPYNVWDDLEAYASSFRATHMAQVNTFMLEPCQFLGYLCLDQQIMVTHNSGPLPIILPAPQDFIALQESLAPKLSYQCRAPVAKITKPTSPAATAMLTNDQVEWLSQQYLSTCAGDRFYLDRHGNIELITSLDGTPAYFYPPYGDAEEVSQGQHRIDIILADIVKRLRKCDQIEKLPEEFIINQIICLGTRRNTTDVTGSHWIVRSVRLSGLNKAKLVAGEITGLYDHGTLSYLNSASNTTSLYFDKCIKRTLKCVANEATAVDIIVPNQFAIGSAMQKGIICGDLAAQNAVCFTIYGCVPSAKQYTTRQEHIGWIALSPAVATKQIRWHFDLSTTLAETFGVAEEIIQLNVCDDSEYAHQQINRIRAKISAYIERESIKFYRENNTFLASLNFLTHKSRTEKLNNLVTLQSLIPVSDVATKQQRISDVVLTINTAHCSEQSKLLFDSVRLIEAIITRTLNRLNSSQQTKTLSANL